MGSSTLDSAAVNNGFRTVQRQLAEALDRNPPGDGSAGPTLEVQRPGTTEPARFARAAIVEGQSLVRRSVPGNPHVGFDAFLDGAQASRVLLHDASIPIVHGSVGAVVRIRNDRRLTTWQHVSEARVYAPRGFLSVATNALLDALEAAVVDTTPRREDSSLDDDAQHPLLLADIAVHAVQGHREALEQRLAESWSGAGKGVLYMDGGISGDPRVAGAANIVGVVKSHRVLYGDPAAVRTILALTEGERSSVFTIGSPERRRSPVASWYLRIRDAVGRDPLWGMVRVEVTPPTVQHTAAIGTRADEVSRWILAEVAPLSLPDSRWDTMVYGIRDCEQFLRAIG